MKKFKFTNTHVSILLVVLATIFLVLLTLLRKSFFGDDAYLLLRFSESLFIFDPLSFGGRFISWGIILPLLFRILPNFIIAILPLVCGILSFFLFSSLLLKFGIKKEKLWLFQLIFIISPAFLSLFGTLNFYFIPFTLLLFSFWLLEKRKYKYAGLISILMPLLNFSFALIGLGSFYLYFTFRRKHEKIKFNPYASISFIVLLVYYGILLLLNGLNSLDFLSVVKISFPLLVKNFIAEFGGIYGISIFFLIFSLIGIANHFKLKMSNIFFFIISLFLFALSLFWEAALVFFFVFIAFFTALGVEILFKKNFHNGTLRFMTLFLVIVGLVFAFCLHGLALMDYSPDESMQGAIEHLQIADKGTVLSSEENGHFITYAGHKNIIDANVELAPNYLDKMKDVNILLNTKSKETAEIYLKKYNINYVLLDPEMKEKLWNNEEGGLWFVMKYSQNFKLIYSEEGVELWKFFPQDRVLTS